MPYSCALIVGMVGIGVLAIIFGVSADLQQLRSAAANIQSGTILTSVDMQRAAIELASFGIWSAGATQKYLLVSIFVFTYLFIEQRSSLKQTKSKASLDHAKVIAWGLLLMSLGFGLVFIPTVYGTSQLDLQQRVEDAAAGSVATTDLATMMEVQQHLEQHDLKWLLLRTITGYGNLLTLAIVGGAIVFRRLVFKDVPVNRILSYLLPSFAMEWVQGLMSDIGISIDSHFAKKST